MVEQGAIQGLLRLVFIEDSDKRRIAGFEKQLARYEQCCEYRAVVEALEWVLENEKT